MYFTVNEFKLFMPEEVWGPWIVCGCWFVNDFFCKTAARGPLIYWWYWKMFAVNYCASCFDIRGNSIGKNLVRLNWEKAVYRPLFTLANTLLFRFLFINFFCSFLSSIQWLSFFLIYSLVLIFLYLIWKYIYHQRRTSVLNTMPNSWKV